MNAPTGKVAAEIDWAKAWREAFFTPCPTCPARWGDKCPGCASHGREEHRLSQVRDSMGSTGTPSEQL